AKRLRRARARASGGARLRDRIRPAAARAVDVGDAGARREDRARTAADAAAERRAHRNRRVPGHEGGRAMRASASALRGAAPRKGAEAALKLPRLRAPLVFGVLALLF